MLVNREDKIINTDKTQTDPALIYREKMKKEKEEAQKKAEQDLIEEAKRKRSKFLFG